MISIRGDEGMAEQKNNIANCQQQLEHQLNHDSLTGLPNCRLLLDRLAQALRLAERNRNHCAVLCLNIDNFKVINACHGYEAGDLALQLLTARLRSLIRASDTIAHFSADTFVVIAEGLERPEAAQQIATHISQRVAADPVEINGQSLTITVRIGISLYPDDGNDVCSVLLHAELAMQQGRELGRSSICFFAPELNQLLVRRIQLEDELRKALDNNEFVLFYQPKVDLATGRVTSAEALIRWIHPERGLVSPLEFIPVAEESGLIEPITDWVLETACTQTQAWHAEFGQSITIAVNISARQFRGTYLTEAVHACLARSGLPARYLELEVTESALMRDLDQAVPLLKELKQSGVLVTLDDFGTGYSSLSYLKRFPVDKLKLDYSFVRDITSDADSASIARAVISMAHSLKLTVVAEGVETESQLEYLRRQGYDEIQGYYVSRPVPAEEFATLFAQGGVIEGLQTQDSDELRILVVDDEPYIIKALSRMLVLHGYKVLHADNAQQALEQLGSTEVALMLTDNRMPGMGGIELCRLARELHPETVRVMLTGYSDLNDTILAINEGAVFKFATKPWDEKGLCDIVAESLQYYRFLKQLKQFKPDLRHDVVRG